MSHWVRCLGAVAIALAGASVPAGADDQGFAFSTLDNGASIGFALLRHGRQASPAAGAAADAGIGDAALARSNAVSRVLWDRETGAYFGYRVQVDRQKAGAFRVIVRALDAGLVEGTLRQKTGCPSCPAPTPLPAASPRYPRPQVLAEGEILTLELLSNPVTGEKILDVVKVSARPLTAEFMQAAAARAREGWEAVERASAHAARGAHQAALAEYLRALRVQPNDASLHNRLGMSYQYLGRDDHARFEYDRALALNPEYAEVWNNVGTLELSLNRLRPAVRAYRKAIALKPSLATPWKNLGNAFLALGQLEEAYEAYREAFRHDPTILERAPQAVAAPGLDPGTQNYFLAKVLASHGQIDAAFDFLERARQAGYSGFGRIADDPDFAGLVKDPRFEEFVKR
jgi:tetratricopeptide (TPR) repeat protein